MHVEASMASFWVFLISLEGNIVRRPDDTSVLDKLWKYMIPKEFYFLSFFFPIFSTSVDMISEMINWKFLRPSPQTDRSD